MAFNLLNTFRSGWRNLTGKNKPFEDYQSLLGVEASVIVADYRNKKENKNTTQAVERPKQQEELVL